MDAKKSATVLMDSLQQFHGSIVDDPRVGPAHVSLYVAILHFASEQEFKRPISVFGKELMKHAKIAGAATYTKCIQELKEFGYIDYIPSFNPLLGSSVYLENVNVG
jgi:hypothetical protein